MKENKILTPEEIGLKVVPVTNNLSTLENFLGRDDLYAPKWGIAVYGSLLPGEHNFVWMAAAHQVANIAEEYSKIKGLSMRSLGGYPASFPATADDHIDVKTMEVDEYAFRHVHAMERGAGYTPYYITINNSVYIVYVQPRPTSVSESFSNWLDYKANKLKPKTPNNVSEENNSNRTEEVVADNINVGLQEDAGF